MKRDFVSTNQAQYIPFKVQPQQSYRNTKIDPEMNNPCFIGSTTYSKTYQNWGAAPGYKPAKESRHTVDMKMKDSTTYNETYGNRKNEKPAELAEQEEKMKKTCINHMQNGSLKRHVEAPFVGKS